MQIVYEHGVRPAEKLHQPWLERITGQLLAACDALEASVARQPLPLTSATIDQASISTAVAWHFIQRMTPEVIDAGRCPTLSAFSAEAEQLPVFRAAPHRDGRFVATK